MESLQSFLPEDWRSALGATLHSSSWQELGCFVHAERAARVILPPEDEVFSAFHYTPFDEVSVVILGQDPYHGAGQAHGLSFSVKPGIKIPPSLRNMYKEIASDLGIAPPSHGFLEHWAKQGVLMFNSVMTVRESEANSHKGKGWESFSDSVIRALNERSRQVVFVLWGGYAKKKAKLVDCSRHKIISSGHPSPLSIKHFAGSQPFSKINSALEEAGETPIDWQLPQL